MIGSAYPMLSNTWIGYLKTLNTTCCTLRLKGRLNYLTGIMNATLLISPSKSKSPNSPIKIRYFSPNPISLRKS